MTNKQNYRTIVQREFRGELSNPIQFASGAKPGVKRKISKTKTEVETKEKKKNTKKTSILHGHSISNGRKVGTGWYLISAVVSLSELQKSCVFAFFML